MDKYSVHCYYWSGNFGISNNSILAQMRNTFKGDCYRCFKTVKPGQGHFEIIRNRTIKMRSKWRVQCASCAIKHRNEKAL